MAFPSVAASNVLPCGLLKISASKTTTSASQKDLQSKKAQIPLLGTYSFTQFLRQSCDLILGNIKGHAFHDSLYIPLNFRKKHQIDYTIQKRALPSLYTAFRSPIYFPCFAGLPNQNPTCKQISSLYKPKKKVPQTHTSIETPNRKRQG